MGRGRPWTGGRRNRKPDAFFAAQAADWDAGVGQVVGCRPCEGSFLFGNVTLHPDCALKLFNGLREEAASTLFPRVAGLSSVKESS